MAKMTITDRDYLTEIIIDELGKVNDKKITKEKLTEEAESLANNFLGNSLKDHETLKQKYKEIDRLMEAIKNEMKIKVDKLLGDDTYWGYGDNFKSYGPLVDHFRRELTKKYDLKKMPKPRDIQKRIILADNKEFHLIIKEIVKALTSKS